MMKKIVALAGAGAILLSMAVPALAIWPLPPFPMPSNDVVISNYASVGNNVSTKADSGDNKIGGMFVCSGTIRTGAATAVADVWNQVNTNEVGCPTCGGDVTIGNTAYVSNIVRTKADSGDNRIGGMWVGGGSITTGAAYAGSLITNFVNSNIVGL